MTKKILIATGVYPPESGGPATYTKLLEERLPKRGIEVSVLPFSKVRNLPKIFRHAAYFWKCLRMSRGADIILAQDTVSVGLPSALAALLAGKKFLVRVPGDYAWEQGSQRFGATVPIDEFQSHYFGVRVALLRAVQKFVVRRALRVIAPSEYLRSLTILWGASPKRVVRIYNGIEFPLPVALPPERPKGFLVVTSARRVPWKGVDRLERVVAMENGWSLFVADTLPRAQALGWAKTADVFVLNSSYEGLSHTLIEVMFLGTPIVATSVGGNPELIRDGVDGLLIHAQDDEALHAALKKIEQDRGAALARGRSAMERAKEFSIDKTLDRLVALIKTL